jgi:3-dehydroquinate dehydratase/shikimate dehydrogenase
MNNGKICVSVCAVTADELIEQIKRAEDLADVIELRFDCLKETEIEIFWKTIKNSLKRFTGVFLVTLRPFEQGGKRKLTLAEREEFWIHSHVFEFVEWADLELDFSEEKINRYWGKTFDKVIKSFHDFEKVPSNIVEIYNQVLENSELAKIAIQADDITDSIAVWKLLARAKSENKQIIPIAMGEAGKWTRILGLAHGAFITYAARETGSETAPGQISAGDLVETYRVRELNEQTEVYGIIGGDTSYSMSPYIHNAAFKFHNLNAVFVPFAVKNLDEFIERFVRRKTREIELNLKGFSVTNPHKQTIIKHLDFVDETARKIGAVNTVKIVGDKFHGFNTDARGFIEPLKTAYGDLKNARVAIIGNGGAARACIYALELEGAKATIYARDTEKAKNLADEFDVSLAELKFDTTNFNSFDVVVNATPLGTIGELENETPATAEQIKNVHLVYDLIYNPFETRFLREAKSVGVPTIGGLAMLIAQAMGQYKFWTTLDAPMKEMSRAALRKLQF